MKFGRLNFFWKYFLSFTLILFIPTLVLSLLNFNFIRSYYRNGLIQKKQIELDNCGNTLSLLLTQINNNIAEYKNRSCFYTFPDGDNTLDFYYEINKSLQSGILTNSYVSEIIFANGLKNTIHTSYEMLRPERFNFTQYGFRNYDDFMTSLGEINSAVFLQTNGTRPVLASPFQRNYSEGGYYSHILFVMNSQALDSVLTPVYNLDEYGFTALYRGSLFLEKGVCAAGTAGEIAINYGNNDAVWLELRIPESTINREIQPLINITFLLIGIILLLSFAIILYLANKYYKPVRKLGETVKEFSGPTTAALDEFEAAQYVLNNLAINKSELLHSNEKLRRDHLLLKLLSRKPELGGSFRDECKNAGLHFNRKYYCCYITGIQVPETEFTQTLDNIGKKAGCEIYALDLEYPENVILIVCSDNITEIEKLLRDEDNKTFLIRGIGKTAGSPEKIYESYAHARHSSLNVPAETVFPSDDLNALRNAILACDEEKINFAVNNILDCIPDSGNFFPAARIYFGYIETIISALSDLNMNPDENFGSFLNAELKSNEEILEKMETAADMVLQVTGRQNSQTKKINKNINDVTDFINENYTGRNFTVKSMADFFGVSVSNLSHYYKQKTGRTLSWYIINLKIEHAKKLLETTNMNLNAVSAAAGYTEISAFIKSFRRITGITPGEYRKLKFQQ